MLTTKKGERLILQILFVFVFVLLCLSESRLKDWKSEKTSLIPSPLKTSACLILKNLSSCCLTLWRPKQTQKNNTRDGFVTALCVV